MITWASQYSWYQKVAPVLIRAFKSYRKNLICYTLIFLLLVAITTVMTVCGPVELLYRAFNIHTTPPIILEILISALLANIIFWLLILGIISALDQMDNRPP